MSFATGRTGELMITKSDVVSYAKSLGAGLVGFAPVERWREKGDLHPNFFPDSVWPETKTVIVMCVPSLTPVHDTKITRLHRSLYNITNQRLDEMAYMLSVYLNRNGVPAIYAPRDGYATDGKILKENPTAAFSHVWAGYYAGLGTVGWNHTLLTRKYGPRHRLVSALSAQSFEGDPLIEDNLCTKCRVCEKACPFESFSSPQDGVVSNRVSADMNKSRCAHKYEHFEGMPYQHCGFCIKTCPVGEDLRLFGSPSTREYFEAHHDFEKWTMGVGGNIDVAGKADGLNEERVLVRGVNKAGLSAKEDTAVSFDAIEKYAQSLGVDIVGFANASDWGSEVNVPSELYPAAIWPMARSVIVLAVRAQNGERDAEARILDEAAYRLAAWLCEQQCPSIHLPSDTGDEDYIAGASMPLFSHECAAKLAGLDSGGIRAVSVLTTLDLEYRKN
ncbi:hypothetical protein AGMMS49957_11690 [Synergistales bacterium]|nr:hypothetical protein AGMMS49957_11690 [Synergistales bacterium]